MKTKTSKTTLGWAVITMLLTPLLACSQENTTNNNCESPYFMVVSEDSENEQLPLKSTMVDVNIAGVIADVNVKQVYSNTGKIPLEAIYIFPASARAAVYNMVMKIGDREIIAIVEEKQQARNMYEQAKNEGKTASLLEEQRPNVFQMNVANIMPGATVEVSLSYTELLVPTDKVYEFVYPTVVGPRYVSQGEIETGSPENWIANPYLNEGVAPTSTLDINVNINAGMTIQKIKCETHKNNIAYKGSSTVNVHLNEPDGGNRDFVLQYQLAGNKIESGILVYEEPNGEKYFLAMVQPPERVKPEEMPAREYVFIVDVSGSMSGFPLDISKSIMQGLLNNLKPTDKFNIVSFAGGSKVYSKESQFASKSNILAAQTFMNSLSGGGGTELLSALKTAMDLNTDKSFARSFVILTDGYVSVEKEAFDYVRENLGNANFFAFGIGSSVNRFLIEGLAHIGCGEPFIATNPNNGKKEANKFVKYVNAPILTNINVAYPGFETYGLLTDKVPDVFAERPLIISGKYKGELNGSIKISGIKGNGPYTNTIRLNSGMASKQAKALKYLWAREKIRLMSDYSKIGNIKELKTAIVELGKEYNLLTEYTSFVAIDSEITNQSPSNISTVKQPLPLPQGVSNLAVSRARYSYNRQGNMGMAHLKNAKNAQPVAITEDMVFECDEEAQIEEEVFFVVEDLPKFKGGDLKDFRKYVQKQIVYPQEALNNKIEGRVFVSFVVDETGKLADIKIVRGVHPLLDREVIRILKLSPIWKPGKHRGKNVRVSFTIPIDFKI